MSVCAWRETQIERKESFLLFVASERRGWAWGWVWGWVVRGEVRARLRPKLQYTVSAFRPRYSLRTGPQFFKAAQFARPAIRV